MLTWYVAGLYLSVVVAKELLETFEDIIDWRGPTSSILPALDDTLVVAEDCEVGWLPAELDNVSHQKFETDCFCPADVEVSLRADHESWRP